jgi:hypothetical protein
MDNFRKSIYIGRLFALIIVPLIFWTLWISFRSPLSRALLHHKPVTGVMIGTPSADSTSNVNTITLIRYDPVSGSLDILHIPPDARMIPLPPLFFTAQFKSSWLHGQNALEYVKFNPAFIFRKVKANLNWLERFLIFLELKNIKQDQIRWIELLRTSGNDITAGIHLLLGGTNPIPQSASAKVTVQVLNASGESGLALQVTRRLRNAGFDVVQWGNAPSLQQKSLIRDYKGNAPVQKIASALSPAKMEIVTQLQSNLLVDVEVILGQNFK